MEKCQLWAFSLVSTLTTSTLLSRRKHQIKKKKSSFSRSCHVIPVTSSEAPNVSCPAPWAPTHVYQAEQLRCEELKAGFPFSLDTAWCLEDSLGTWTDQDSLSSAAFITGTKSNGNTVKRRFGDGKLIWLEARCGEHLASETTKGWDLLRSLRWT